VTGRRSPRRDFRAVTQRRGTYDSAMMFDVQLQVAVTGALVWAQSFSDEEQAEAFQRQLDEDLRTMEDEPFRRKYGVPSST
jgi:hypothetical protein